LTDQLLSIGVPGSAGAVAPPLSNLGPGGGGHTHLCPLGDRV
jgi:hypothetical protein